jgi:hypothetical protein
MNTLKKLAILLATLFLLIGTAGCEQADEAKKAASEAITQTVDEAKQAVGIGPEASKEAEDQGEKEDSESGGQDDTEDSKEH